MAPPAPAATMTTPPPESEGRPSVARASGSIVFAAELSVGTVSIASTLTSSADDRVAGDAARFVRVPRTASAIVGSTTLMVVATRTLAVPTSREMAAGEMPPSWLARLVLYEVSSKEETSPAMITVKRMKVIGGGDGSGGDGGGESGIDNAGGGGVRGGEGEGGDKEGGTGDGGDGEGGEGDGRGGEGDGGEGEGGGGDGEGGEGDGGGGEGDGGEGGGGGCLGGGGDGGIEGGAEGGWQKHALTTSEAWHVLPWRDR